MLLSLPYLKTPLPRSALTCRDATQLRGIRVTPEQRFEVSSQAVAWMMERLFLGTGVRMPDAVQLSVYEVG